MKLIENIWKLIGIDREERVLEAVFRSSFLNLLARACGYARSVAIAVIIGFSYKTDAAFMALSLIGIFLLFVDVFDSIGVPQLVMARIDSEVSFRKITGLLFSFTVLISFVVSFLALFLLSLILKIPAGFSKEAITATKDSYLLLLPYLFLSFYFHHFGAVLRSQRRFTVYFVGELIFSFSSFLVTAFGLWITKDYRVIPLSFSVSQLFATLYMVYVGKEFLHFSLYWDSATRKLLSQFIQLLMVYSIFHLYILVDKAFASFLGEKAVSALHYGLLLATALRNVFKFEHIGITPLSESKASLEKLNYYLKYLAVIAFPVSLFLVVFSPFIVKLFFGYGAFSRLDVDLTAVALRFYALSLPFMFFWPIIYRAFQIRERIITISFIALLGVIVNTLANYFFVFVAGLGIAGVCLGTFVAYIMICGLGYALFRSLP
ncbi:MAG: lipid II flippase MurJ [candidate division WOR-3 bacterium]